jgi:hypothetical protein
VEPEIALAGLKQSLASLRPKSLPCGAILNRGKGMVLVCRDEGALQLFRTACMSQKIALATARRRRINVRS